MFSGYVENFSNLHLDGVYYFAKKINVTPQVSIIFIVRMHEYF